MCANEDHHSPAHRDCDEAEQHSSHREEGRRQSSSRNCPSEVPEGQRDGSHNRHDVTACDRLPPRSRYEVQNREKNRYSGSGVERQVTSLFPTQPRCPSSLNSCAKWLVSCTRRQPSDSRLTKLSWDFTSWSWDAISAAAASALANRFSRSASRCLRLRVNVLGPFARASAPAHPEAPALPGGLPDSPPGSERQPLLSAASGAPSPVWRFAPRYP